jgi:Arylsulfatase A and related enzymes
MTGHAQVNNVVLITVDSLRADAIGTDDNRRHTPTLDSLAAEGAVFDNAFATGNWTPFSFPSILGSRPVFSDTGRIGVDETPTLAAVLSDADEELTTAGFNAANGFLTSHWGYDAGFDQFEPFVADTSSDIYSRYLATHPTVEAWIQLATASVRRFRSWLSRGSTDRPFLDSSRMFDVESASMEFITESSTPFFLWVHYMDTHTPYVPAPRYIREVSSDVLGTHQMLHAHLRTGLGRTVDERTLNELRTLYQAAVRQVDASIGRLRESLASAGVEEETAIIIAGDHGEEFQDTAISHIIRNCTTN